MGLTISGNLTIEIKPIRQDMELDDDLSDEEEKDAEKDDKTAEV